MTSDVLWRLIAAHGGGTFRTVRGVPFSYSVRGDLLDLHNTNQTLPRVYLERAAALCPLPNVMAIKSLRGNSYIFGILMDSRIRAGGW